MLLLWFLTLDGFICTLFAQKIAFWSVTLVLGFFIVSNHTQSSDDKSGRVHFVKSKLA